MKFITEEDLRDLYKRQPFTNYDLQPGERLTPGARQFLVDRGIDMYDRNDPFTGKKGSDVKTEDSVPAPSGDRKKKKFCGRVKSLEILFLLTAEELLHRDVCMAQQLTELYRQFTLLGRVPEGNCETGNLSCKACSGINSDNFEENIGNCFEITEFHMQMAKGREMLLLARLRSELEELNLDLEDFLEEEGPRGQVEKCLNQIINTLSQMICGALGGKECQRSM